MTANQIKGKGFRGALRYNLDKVNKGVAEVLDYSFAELSEKTIMKEVEFRRMGHPNLKKFFYHTSINFPPYENVSNATMKLIAHDYLQLNGFTEHQYLVVRHNDAAHPHMHIMVNRIGANGKVLSDSNDFARSEKALRVLEVKYNLTQVVSSRQAKVRAATKDELEMMKRTNQPSHKLEMQVIIKNVLNSKQKLTSSEFIQALKSKGIDVRFNQASTGYVSGISYSYKRITIKGAKLGNDYKWTTLRNNIDYDQQRDRSLVANTNVSLIPVNHARQGREDKVFHKVNVVKSKPLSPGTTSRFRQNDEEAAVSNLKVVFNSNILETLIQVDAQPELNPGILLTPKKKKRRKRKRI